VRQAGSRGVAVRRRRQLSCGRAVDGVSLGGASGVAVASIDPRMAMISATACLQLKPTWQVQVDRMWVPPARVSRSSTVVE
jgi:hypothetical protein